MQSRTVPGLQLFSSMPKMPQNKQRVQSASARIEAKLHVWNLTHFHTPISHQIFQHVGENTIHHPTYSNHPIISWIQHFPFFMDGSQLGDLLARRHFTLRQQHSGLTNTSTYFASVIKQGRSNFANTTTIFGCRIVGRAALYIPGLQRFWLTCNRT